MTLALCWVRELPDYGELIIASDSRTRGSGVTLNSCLKVMKLPRGDGIICYAGNTIYAYPLLTQAISAIENFYKSKSRALTLDNMVGHLRRFFTATVEDRELYAGKDEIAREINRVDVQFIVGGYCWKDKIFKMYVLKYEESTRSFSIMSSRNVELLDGRLYNFCIVGDEQGYLSHLLKSRLSKLKSVNMEPLYFLSEIMDDHNYETIGGNIQVYRCYQHLNTAPLPIIKDGSIFAFGRKLLEYERLDLGHWDFDLKKLLKRNNDGFSAIIE